MHIGRKCEGISRRPQRLTCEKCQTHKRDVPKASPRGSASPCDSAAKHRLVRDVARADAATAAAAIRCWSFCCGRRTAKPMCHGGHIAVSQKYLWDACQRTQRGQSNSEHSPRSRNEIPAGTHVLCVGSWGQNPATGRTADEKHAKTSTPSSTPIDGEPHPMVCLLFGRYVPPVCPARVDGAALKIGWGKRRGERGQYVGRVRLFSVRREIDHREIISANVCVWWYPSIHGVGDTYVASTTHIHTYYIVTTDSDPPRS